jgi:uncharacterized protein (TIGR03083 family)
MTSHPEFVAEVRRLAAEFARVTRVADLEADVAACPGWNVHHLVTHLGVVHRWAATIVMSGERSSIDVDDPPHEARGAAAWYAEGAAELVGALDSADPSASCWNFTGLDQHKGFWSRRQTHELQVHLLDLTRAADAGMDPVAPEICADGVGEVLDTFMPRLALRHIYPDLVAPLAIVATDVHVAWILSPRAGDDVAAGTGASRLPTLNGPLDERPGLPEDQVRGDAQRLLEVLWKRSGPEWVEMRGSRDRVGRYLSSQLTS